jgi:tripartite-type tricarboxylate transporter receptor subunit TctC
VKRFRLLLCAGPLAVATLGGAGVALAQADFPSRPIKLVIPFPPGGGTDFVSRTVGTKLAELNKWQVVLENQPGAGGNIAVANAAKAPPDGYTIVMGQSDNMMLGPWLYNNVGYDTVKSFAPIVQVSIAPLAIVSNAAPGQGAPRITSTADMVARGKSPAGLSWATAGNGTVGHLFGEQFRRVAGISLLQVPYKGATPGLADVMGGSVDVAIMSVPSVIGLVRGGKLTPLAVTTTTRSPTLPDTPTLAEAGVRGVDTGIWLGLFAPAGTPPAVVQRLNAEVNRVLQQPDVRERIASGGAQPVGGTSEAFAAFVRTDYERWGRIAREANIKIE